MKKGFHKLIAFVLTMTIALSTGSITYAAPANATDDKSIYELEQFLSMDDDLIVFDTESALENGYSDDIVMAVNKHISDMNDWVTQGIAYIDENYAAVILFPSTRARGESKVVSYWYGLIEVYMNSDETQALINGLSNMSDTLSWTAFLSLIPTHLAGAISGIGGLTALSATATRLQVERAAAGGNGIIMRIHTNVITGGQPVISYVSQ